MREDCQRKSERTFGLVVSQETYRLEHRARMSEVPSPYVRKCVSPLTAGRHQVTSIVAFA